MALYAEMINATNDGKSISPMNFDKKAYQNSEIYKAKRDIEKQTSEYLKIKKIKKKPARSQRNKKHSPTVLGMKKPLITEEISSMN